MSSDIDFLRIIPRGGDRRSAFEELSYILFKREYPHTNSAVRREGSGGDGGLEAYVPDENGFPITGLQAKYFPNKFGRTQWKQIRESGRTAIKKNREYDSLNTYLYTIPRNFNESEESQWRIECENLNRFAKDQGFTKEITFIKWAESDIRDRLLKPENRGLLLHYFELPDFDVRACNELTYSTIENLSDRYLPDLHVETDSEDYLHRFLRSEHFRRQLIETARDELSPIFQLPAPDENWPNTLLKKHEDCLATVSQLQNAFGTGNTIPNCFQKALDILESTHKCLCDLIENLRNHLREEGEAQSQPTNSRPVVIEDDRYEQFATARSAASFFIGYLNDCKVADSQCLLLTGRPGQGKTHAVADVCSKISREGGVALLMEARLFVSSKPLWLQVMRELDYPSQSQADFLANFEALKPTNGMCNLICIDALNESDDRNIWKKRLASFSRKLRDYPGIKLIVTCRSDYASQTLPKEILEARSAQWSRVEHGGFGINVIDAIPKYFREYEIKGFGIPPLAKELNTPLFLKIFCETFKGKSPSSSADSLPQILKAYTNRKSEGIAESIDCAPGKVTAAIKALGYKTFSSDQKAISYEEASDICIKEHPVAEESRSLLKALIDEEVLGKIPLPQNELLGSSDGVRFTYERIWDYFLSLHFVPEGTAPDKTFLKLLSDPNWRIENSGIVSMLAIRFPPELGVELTEVIRVRDGDYFIESALEESFPWRTKESWTEETTKLFERITSNRFGGQFEDLIGFSFSASHPRNADYLHNILNREALAERDRGWTIWVTSILSDGGYDSNIANLLTWARNGDVSDIPDNSLLLLGTTLAWMATTTATESRREIINGLSRIVAGRAKVAAELLERFIEVDDPYVVEAVLISSLGAVQSDEIKSNELARIAKAAYAKFFVPNITPPHVLLRHYAFEICRLANSKGLLDDVSHDLNLSPPWNSRILRVWSERTVEKITTRHDTSKSSVRISTLLHSLEPNVRGFMYGNFGRYVMESRVEAFLKTRLDRSPPAKIEHNDRFDALKAKRFIVQKVFQLGWDPELTDGIQSSGYHSGQQEKIERISKKYQWIGLYELLGILMDKYHYAGWSSETRELTSVREVCRYDVHDPYGPDTLRLQRNEEIKQFQKPRPVWWQGHLNPFPFSVGLDVKRTRASAVTEDDPKCLLEFSNEKQNWITLHAFIEWREEIPIWERKFDFPQSSLHWAIQSYLVTKEQAHKLAEKLSQMTLTNSQLWLQEPEFGQSAHKLQSYPYGQSILERSCNLDNDWTSERWRTGAISTTCRFSSSEENSGMIRGSMPSPHLARTGQLRWSGFRLDFVNDESTALVFRQLGRYPKESCIIQKEKLLHILKEQNLTIVWRCFGEKVITNDHSHPGGRAYWMAFSMDEKGELERHNPGTIEFPVDLNDPESVNWAG